MKVPGFFERVPAHLACAIAATSFVLLGTGASCGRPSESERATPTAAAPAPPKAPDAAPKSALADTLTPPAPSSAAPSAPPATSSATPPAPSTALVPRSRRYVIAALGDSITDKRSHGGGYLDFVAKRCPASAIDNYGKGGDMTNQMRARLERDLLPRARERGYTHLVVFGGVNDLYSDLTAGRTNDRIESDLSAIYGRAHEYGMAVVAVTVAPWGGYSRYFDARRGENTRLLNAWMKARTEAGVVQHVVDAYALLACGDPELLCPEFEPPFHDGLHPGTKGHEVLGKALFETAFADCR